MILIPVVLVDSILNPSQPIPASAVRIVCDGTNYTVYEQGDDLPPEPIYDEQL